MTDHDHLSIADTDPAELADNRELVRENAVLRSNSDHLSSENASLSRQVESMAMRIESLAEELAKPEDVRLREVIDALDGRAVIFDGLGARVGHLLDEMDEWIERAGVAERVQARVSGRRIMSSCRATNAKREADADPCTTYIRLYLPTGIELPMADGPITADEEEMFAEWFEDRLHSLFPRLDLRVYWTGVEETKIYLDGTDGIQRNDIFALLTALYPMWERGVL